MILYLITLTLLQPGFGSVLPTEGKEFTPKNKNYTIKMPDIGTVKHRSKILMMKGNRIPVESAEVSAENGPVYSAGTLGIPVRLLKDIPQAERYDLFRDGMVKQVNGKVTSTKEITQDTIPGKEYFISGDKKVIRLQLFLEAGWIMFIAIEGKTKEEVTTKEADSYLTSLTFSDKIKDIEEKGKKNRPK